MLPTIVTAKTLAFAPIIAANRELTGTVIHRAKYDRRSRLGGTWTLNKLLLILVQAEGKAILSWVVQLPLRR